MKRIHKTPLTLLLIGTGLMSLSFIVKQFASLSDTFDGLLKGMAIGFLLLSLIFLVKYRKTEV
jgi:hypothetical protein